MDIQLHQARPLWRTASFSVGVTFGAISFHGFAWIKKRKIWWNSQMTQLFLSHLTWKWPQVNQVNGSGLPWCEPFIIIIFLSAVHRGETHGMYSKDVRGGQRASLAFLWCPPPLWRCPPAPFTFEFLSRPNRSVVKYTLKSYEFMNFTQVYLSPSPYHQGESFPCSEGEVATCGEGGRKKAGGAGWNSGIGIRCQHLRYVAWN